MSDTNPHDNRSDFGAKNTNHQPTTPPLGSDSLTARLAGQVIENVMRRLPSLMSNWLLCEPDGRRILGDSMRPHGIVLERGIGDRMNQRFDEQTERLVAHLEQRLIGARKCSHRHLRRKANLFRRHLCRTTRALRAGLFLTLILTLGGFVSVEIPQILLTLKEAELDRLRNHFPENFRALIQGQYFNLRALQLLDQEVQILEQHYFQYRQGQLWVLVESRSNSEAVWIRAIPR